MPNNSSHPVFSFWAFFEQPQLVDAVDPSNKSEPVLQLGSSKFQLTLPLDCFKLITISGTVETDPLDWKDGWLDAPGTLKFEYL